MDTKQMKLPKPLRSWLSCARCGLCEDRKNVVLYDGELPCDVLFIGEAPGRSEDVLGKPFIGRSGKLLRQMIGEVATNLTLEWNLQFTWGITNIVACLPISPKTKTFRPPTDAEVAACRPRLNLTLDYADPKLIVLLGKTAEEHYPADKSTIPTVAVYHPSYLLRIGGAMSMAYSNDRNKLRDAIRTTLLGGPDVPF